MRGKGTEGPVSRTRAVELEVLRGKIRDYWDAHPIATQSSSSPPGSPEFYEALDHRWQARSEESRRGLLETCRGHKVLEVGCGVGAAGRFLREHGVDYQAVDLSRRSLELVRDYFRLRDLEPRFVNADATALPFRDGSFGFVFSIGVLHHVPEARRACREVVRITEPGGSVRVMLYNRHSYHYWLVAYVIRPIVWLLLRLSIGVRLLGLAPAKLRAMVEISREHGFDKQRLLDISTDVSEAGENDYDLLSYFFSEAEMREIFGELLDHRFERMDLKYFPLPWLRRAVEKRWGFFLTMTARRPAAATRP